MAAVDFFLKIDGIEGESQDKTHKNEIQLESWSWGATNAGSMSMGGGGGTGKVALQDFHFTMPANKSTPKLLKACATGEHIKSAVLTCRKAGKEQQEYLKYSFTDVFISSYQTAGSSAVPIDQCSFNFTKMQCDYKEQKSDGTLGGAITAWYDIKKQQAG
jgi:type VI secretion system secreted protein Hcp